MTGVVSRVVPIRGLANVTGWGQDLRYGALGSRIRATPWTPNPKP